jgi:hypothetical protein
MSKKIIIRIKGGLGNQLFQYCLGEFIYSRLKIIVNYDIKTGYLNDSFNRKNSFHSLYKQNNNLIYTGILNNIYLLRILKRLSIKFNIPIAKYIYLEEDKNIFIVDLIEYLNKTKNNIILEGYWQDISIVNSKFIAKLNTSLIDPIINYSKNDLIVHYRSDNFSDSLKFEYFESSINFMLHNFPNINIIIIYSDSKKVLNLLDYLKSRFNIKIEVDFNDYDPFLLMSTVSRSNYFIPSNGTFSLWSMLLGENRFILLPPNMRTKDLSNFKNFYLTGSE